jgi:hypothetical protein
VVVSHPRPQQLRKAWTGELLLFQRERQRMKHWQGACDLLRQLLGGLAARCEEEHGVEARVDRVLEKFGVSLEDLFTPPGALEAQVVRSQLPAAAIDALERLRRTLEEEYGAVERAATEIDPTPARPTQAVRQPARRKARVSVNRSLASRSS